MRVLLVSFVICICLFPALNIYAVDKSFTLDFDGDGRTDLALYREGSRDINTAPQLSYFYYFNTHTMQIGAIIWGQTLDVPAPADYDNDGKTDAGIYRWWDFKKGDTNIWWIYKSSGGVQTLVYEPGYNKFSRNYFGDGKAEIGQLYQVDISQNPPERCLISIYFAADLEGNELRKTISDTCNVIPTPAPGDYNKDGRSEIAVFVNRTFKVWYPPYSSSYTPPDVVQPLDVDSPAPGDYDGDGRTDFAGTTTDGTGRMIWRIKLSRPRAQTLEAFGLATDKAIPGDYDGDGRTDLAVFRPGDATWFIRYSSDGGIRSFAFGQPTDTPLAMPVIPFNPTSSLTDHLRKESFLK